MQNLKIKFKLTLSLTKLLLKTVITLQILNLKIQHTIVHLKKLLRLKYIKVLDLVMFILITSFKHLNFEDLQ